MWFKATGLLEVEWQEESQEISGNGRIGDIGMVEGLKG
jgi:hypothetical protein